MCFWRTGLFIAERLFVFAERVWLIQISLWIIVIALLIPEFLVIVYNIVSVIFINLFAGKLYKNPWDKKLAKKYFIFTLISGIN